MSIEGKVAIVTGGSLGIGAGIAKRLAKDGAKVVITGPGRRAAPGDRRRHRGGGGEVLAIPGDAGVAADVEAMFRQVLDTWGTVDIVVNNAGWASPIAHILEMDQDHWDTVIRTNLTSIYLHCHRAANIMVDQGKKGAIVNISSFAGYALAPLHGGVRRDQGRHGGDDPHDGDRPGGVRHPRQRGPAGRDPHRGSRRQPGGAGPARRDRAAGAGRLPGRHRRGGPLAGRSTTRPRT